MHIQISTAQISRQHLAYARSQRQPPTAAITSQVAAAVPVPFVCYQSVGLQTASWAVGATQGWQAAI